MSHILVAFSTKKNDWLSRLTGEYRTGVRVVPSAYMLQRDMLEIRKIPHPDPEVVWRHAEQMAREKVEYDHEYIGAWLLRRGDGDDHKVTCHELIEVAAARAGHLLFPPDLKNTSPRDLYLISKEL